MKLYLHLSTCLGLLLGAGCASAPPLAAQSPVPVVTAASAEVAPMDQLLAPIALYPDALVAIILPAATASSDIVLAARFLSAGNPPDQIDAQPWDDSVKALAHYPDVVKWMDENLAWTQQLGAAYLDQPQEVMAAVQRNRQRAKASGLLADTPQQQVVMDDTYIRIIPAQPDIIYVPRYDPQILYVEQPVYYYPDPWITFGIGFGVGAWLSYDCDWRGRVIWVDRRHDRWRDHRDWRQPVFPSRPGVSRPPGWQQWHPLPGRPRPQPRNNDSNRWKNPPHPSPIVGAPPRDRNRNQPPANRPPNAGAERPDRNRPPREGNAPRNTAEPPPRATVSPQPAPSGDHASRPNDQTRNAGETPRRRVAPQRPPNAAAPATPAVRNERRPAPAVVSPAVQPNGTPPVVRTPQPQRQPEMRPPPSAPRMDRSPPPPAAVAPAGRGQPPVAPPVVRTAPVAQDRAAAAPPARSAPVVDRTPDKREQN